MKIHAMRPFDGLESFDDALGAMIVVVLDILQQKYHHVYEGVVDTAGDVAGMYFLVITLIGVFFLLNYTTASLTFAYAQICKWTATQHFVVQHYDTSDPHQPHAHARINPTEKSETATKVEHTTSHQNSTAHDDLRTHIPSRTEILEDDDDRKPRGIVQNSGSEVWHPPVPGGSGSFDPHFFFRGVVSARQFFEQISNVARKRWVELCRFAEIAWRPFVRPFAMIVAHPNPVGEEADLCVIQFLTAPYTEILVRIVIICHVSMLASVTHDSSRWYVSAIHEADIVFLLFFASMKLLCICAYAGLR